MPAPGGWFSCRVERAGAADDGRIYLSLTDLGVPPKFGYWFYAIDAMKREMLATALTAISTGLAVEVALESTDEYSQVNRMYLRR
jgi:hypothetical protein